MLSTAAHNSINDRNQSRKHRRTVLGIILGAVIIRVLLALISDNLNHPDENFQILEQAHRLVFGYGIIPWEFRFNVRSWLIPGFIAGWLYSFKILGLDSPNIYIPAIRIILGLFSIIIVVSAYYIGRHLSSARAGILACLFCAIWYEIVYFSIRPFNEVFAATFILASLALLYESRTPRGWIISGLLSGLAAAVRIHYLPIVALLAVIAVFTISRRGRLFYMGTLLLTILIAGVFDKITLGGFYSSYINYLTIGKIFNVAESSPAADVGAYLSILGRSSLDITWVVFFIALVFWKKTKHLLLIVIVAVATHMFLPIKEHLVSIRFVYVIIPTVMIIAGVILAEMERLCPNKTAEKAFRLLAVFLVSVVSLAGALGLLEAREGTYGGSIFARDPSLRAYRFLYSQEKIHAIFDTYRFWFLSGGYYYLHRNVPLYFNNTPPPSLSYVSHVISEAGLSVPGEFKLIKSFKDVNIYARFDPDFKYEVDRRYSRDMFQPGIDDKLKSPQE
jgi:phosphatidylinositol glycan class B